MAVAVRTFQNFRSHPVAVYIVHKRSASTGEHPTKLTSLKRGTGGRSSFSGVIATVFGASGFLGKHVVNKLGKVGTQVVVPYRGDHYPVLPLKLCGDLGQIIYTPFNLKDEESLYKAMKYSNVVINLIGKDTETGNFSFEDVHVTGARKIARIARESGIQRLVHVSALNACEHPKPVILKKGSQFYASKWRGENAVREEFPEAIFFRPADIYGQQDRFLFYYGMPTRSFLHLVPLWNKGRNIVKQPVCVSDIAAAIVNSVFEKDSVGKTYEAVGPNRYELLELVKWFHRVMRKNDYMMINMKYDVSFWIRLAIIEKFYAKYPWLSWERIEREHTTDILTPGLPNLEDLGVQLTDMGERLAYELNVFRAMSYYEDFGAYDTPEPAPVFKE